MHIITLSAPNLLITSCGERIPWRPSARQGLLMIRYIMQHNSFYGIVMGHRKPIYLYIYTTFWVGRIVVGFNCFFFGGHETELPMYSAVAGRRLPLGSSSWRPCTVWSFYTSHGHPVHRSYFAPRYTLPAFTPCVRPRPERLVAHPRLSMLCWELSEVRKQDVSSGHMSYLDIS